MADYGALSLFYNEMKGFTRAIEGHLAVMADLSQRYTGPKVWSLLEKQAWVAIYEIAGRCFELGAASIQLSHEFIAFFSSPDETGIAARSRDQLLAEAIEDITVISTKFHEAAKTALDAMSTLDELDFMAKAQIDLTFDSRLPRYLSTNKHFRLRDWAAKLGEILSSINAQKFVVNGIMLNNVIAVFQGHVVRVCLLGLSLTENFGPSLTANIDSPLMGALHREVLPDVADSVGVLANYVENNYRRDRWKSGDLMEMLAKDIISVLMHLETHLSEFSDEMTPPLSELLTQYAAVFTSLLSAFSSMLAFEQCLDKLVTTDTHLLALDPSVALQPLLAHREASQRAIVNAQSDVNFLVLRLKQLQENSDASWSKPPENVPEPLTCIKCLIKNLLSHSEEVLATKILAPQKWKWVTSEPKSDVAFIEAIRPLFSGFSRARRKFYLTIFTSLLPYHHAGMGNPVALDIQLPKALEPPSPFHAAFGPHHNLRPFWTQLSLLANKQREHLYPGEGVPFSLTLFERWRPCTCKKQIEFATESRQSKHAFQVGGQGNPAEAIHLPIALPLSQKPSSDMKERHGDSLQGNWSW